MQHNNKELQTDSGAGYIHTASCDTARNIHGVPWYVHRTVTSGHTAAPPIITQRGCAGNQTVRARHDTSADQPTTNQPKKRESRAGRWCGRRWCEQTRSAVSEWVGEWANESAQATGARTRTREAYMPTRDERARTRSGLRDHKVVIASHRATSERHIAWSKAYPRQLPTTTPSRPAAVQFPSVHVAQSTVDSSCSGCTRSSATVWTCSAHPDYARTEAKPMSHPPTPMSHPPTRMSHPSRKSVISYLNTQTHAIHHHAV